MNIWIVVPIAALLIQGLALAQESAEALSIQPPKAWGSWKQIFDQRAPDGNHLTGFAPPDQDRSTWKEAISIYTFASRPAGDVTTEVIRNTMKQSNAACVTMNIVRPNPRTEGFFTVAYAQVYCAERRDKKVGRIEFIKAIASERRVYLIIVMKNVKPFRIAAAGTFNFADDESVPIVDWLKETSDYLTNNVRVCIGPIEKRTACSS